MNEDVDFKSLGFRSKEMHEFPNIVNIEVYRGGCYCSCVHCPVGTTEPSDRKKRFGNRGMNLELYKKIIAEVSQHPHSTVRIHSVGEPLIWEDLIKALRVTHDHNVRSWIFTCLVTSDTGLLKAICDNTSIVEVSVNSTTPKDYRATKGINAFELVSRNIRDMHKYIISRNLHTRLITSRVQSPDEAADQEFVRYWRTSGLVHDAFVRSYHTYNDMMPELPAEGGQHKHEACLVHWARFNISVDGYAVVCFNELFKKHLDPSLILGDLREQSIAEIWHGPKLTALRRAELNGDYSNLPFREALPCKDCYSCQPLNGNRETSEHQVEFLKMIEKIKRTAGMILVNSKNEVLLQRRDNKPGILFPESYALFGGEIEEGETKETALKREIEEEIGVKLNKFSFFKTYYYQINNEIHETHVFLVHENLNQKDIKLKEGAGFGFFSKSKIKTIKLGFNTEQILTDFFNALETGEIK